MSRHDFIMDVIDLKEKYFKKDSEDYKWITNWIDDFINWNMEMTLNG